VLEGEAFSDAALRALQRVSIVGCGTALHAGMIARYMIEEIARVPVDAERRAGLSAGTLLIASFAGRYDVIPASAADRLRERDTAVVIDPNAPAGNTKGNLAGASADAGLIPSNTFVYRMPYYVNTVDQYNRIYWASANQPYRAHTVWGTFYDNYRRTTRDPRVPFDSSLTVRFGDAAVTSLGGQVRWFFQTKYPVRESSINLSSGWEMRLIEAEALLVGGDVAGAMTKLNARRIALSLTPWTANNATEAWTALKRERGIELWLEGRRMADFRRWKALNRPGDQEDMAGRDLCFPIPLSELETNPNLR
jgi:hypothetical protein